MEILKVSNYKQFSNDLKAYTGCDVSIKIMGENHFHYQLIKDGISLGILCVDKGVVSFAPFVDHEDAKNEQYISVDYLPMVDDLIVVLNAFKNIFIEGKENS